MLYWALYALAYFGTDYRLLERKNVRRIEDQKRANEYQDSNQDCDEAKKRETNEISIVHAKSNLILINLASSINSLCNPGNFVYTVPIKFEWD